ncbi:MAG: HAD-IC family P-type ATPase [Saprospiraceae bacterium]
MMTLSDQAVIGGLKNKEDISKYAVQNFIPFDPVHKRTEAELKDSSGNEIKVTKGAPQVIIELSTNTDDEKNKAKNIVSEFAEKGYRALGVALDKGDGKWLLTGILPLFDPPRVDAAETISTASKLGVKVKMVTGDAIAIAKEIAGKLGLGTNILDASNLGKTSQDNDITSIEQADGFAQVFPEHKFHIVDELQSQNHIVGMTGDGVNDAPALKKADCGIAVSGATDAARAAADIVLMTPGLSVIIKAIEESRKIFQRMNSYTIYRIAETLRVLFFMTLSILVFNFYPVTAIMIVLLAILNDGAIISIAYDNVKYSKVPEAWNMKRVLTISSILGLAGVVASFLLFYLAERVFHVDRAMIQSLIYLKLSVAGQLTIFVTRTKGPFWSIKPSKTLLIAVITAQIIATLISVYGIFMSPIGWKWAGFVWGYAVIWFFISDSVKRISYKLIDKEKSN